MGSSGKSSRLLLVNKLIGPTDEPSLTTENTRTAVGLIFHVLAIVVAVMYMTSARQNQWNTYTPIVAPFVTRVLTGSYKRIHRGVRCAVTVTSIGAVLSFWSAVAAGQPEGATFVISSLFMTVALAA